MRVFQNLAFSFKHTSNTVFLLMSACRFKKTGIHLTAYLKWLATPSHTWSSCPPQVWCQNYTEPVHPLGLRKWLKFQIPAVGRIRAKQDHEASSPGLHWYVRWRADSVPQTTRELHNVGAWSLPQSCHGQKTCEHCLTMCCILLHNMFFISLATLHLLEIEGKEVSFSWTCFSRVVKKPWILLEIFY